MWILVLLMISSSGQMFNAHPNVMTETECQEAKVAVEADLSNKLKDAPDMKVTLRCVQWGPQEKAE